MKLRIPSLLLVFVLVGAACGTGESIAPSAPVSDLKVALLSHPRPSAFICGYSPGG